MTRIRSLGRAAGLTTLAAFAGAAALLSPAHAQPQPGSVLRFVPQADVRMLDPMMSSAYTVRNHAYMVFDTLYSLNSQSQPKPQMLESGHVSGDGKTWTFKLRSGLKWHDGTPVKAADCVASLKRWMKKSAPARDLAGHVTSLAATDDSTFVLQLDAPGLAVLDTLAIPTPIPAFMMPERLANTDPNTPVTEAVGSGPFMFKRDEWQPGKKLVYVRNPNYLPRSEPPDFLSGGKVAKVDRVEWIVIPDANAAASALQAGEVDYLEQPSFDALKGLKANPAVRLQVIDPLGEVDFMRVNFLHPPFDNVKARQALRYIVKQQDYMQAITGDPAYYRTCDSYYACGGPYEANTGGVAQDMQKARDLLKEAGYKGEKVVLLATPTIAHFNTAAQITAQNLRKAGVNVDVVVLEWGALTQRRGSREPISNGGWNIVQAGMGGLDAQSPLSNIALRTDCADTSPAAFGWACDKDFERLRAELLAAPTAAKRKELAQALQARATEIVPQVNIGQFTRPVAYRTNVKGVLDAGIPVFWNIEKK